VGLREELDVPGDFPPEVIAEAEDVARRPLPDDAVDLRHVDFRTLDPPGARDLDQAYALEEGADGWVVRYAIADLARFVDPGGAIDVEAHRRGVTYYLPDGKAPLHPPVLSEGAASLLPGVDRPAVVYTVMLATGEARVERAIVRSREQLEYETATDAALQAVGELLEAEEAERGGVSLDLPSQEVVADGGRFVLRTDVVLPIEGWNEQLSLLAGRVAARLMLDGGIGILRTMPPPDDGVVRHLRRLAKALGVEWRDTYAETVRGVDRGSVAGVVFLRNAVRALRGAGYVAFDGDVPELTTHSAVAAPYAHVTAPLRRLGDRAANEVVLALSAGTPVPAWARADLPGLPEILHDANRRAAAVERAAVDEVEALLLSSCTGAELDATVVSVESKDATVVIDEPVVVARMPAGPGWKPGDGVRVRVVGADPAARRVDLAPA
jgi:exoribonuclease R